MTPQNLLKSARASEKRFSARTIVLAISSIAFAVSVIAPKAYADPMPICQGGGLSLSWGETFVKSFSQQNCSLLLWGYVYNRQVVKTSYSNGVTYFCTNWQFNGSCGLGGSSAALPACPGSTCSKSLVVGD